MVQRASGLSITEKFSKFLVEVSPKLRGGCSKTVISLGREGEAFVFGTKFDADDGFHQEMVRWEGNVRLGFTRQNGGEPSLRGDSMTQSVEFSRVRGNRVKQLSYRGIQR